MRQPRKQRTPETRGAKLVASKRKRIRRNYRKTDKARGKRRMPGEILFKQDMAIILSLAGYTHEEIGLSLGEGKNTITEWLNMPDVMVKYEKITEALPEAARTLLETYSIEAVHTLVDIMRTSEDDKTTLDAIKEILDRGGLPKLSKTEQTKEEKLVVTDDGLVDRLREASPEIQEQASGLVEALEQLLSDHAGSQKPEVEQQEDTNG